MAYSIQKAVSDGTLITLMLSLEVFSTTHVRVILDGQVTTNYVWEGTTVRFPSAIPAGVVVTLQRVTPSGSVLNIFSDRATFRDESVDANFRQTLFLTQEAQEGGAVRDVYNNIDMHLNHITNMADAVNPQDAVTLGQVGELAGNFSGVGVSAVLAKASSAVAVDAGDMSVGTTGVTAIELPAPSGASIIGTLSGATVQDGFSKGGLVRGTAGKSFISSGAAVRRNTAVSPDWQFVEDPTHIPINCVGIEQGVDLNIKYVGDKIGTLIAGPDESFARDGVLVGGSVGPRSALISAGAACSFVIDFDNSNAITFDTKFFGAVRFGITKTASGQLTVTHPSRRLMQMPVVQHFAGNSMASVLNVHYVSAPSSGGFTCFLLGEAEGHISFNAGWKIGSSTWTDAEMTYTYDALTGSLKVVHPTLVGSASCIVTPWSNGALVHTQLKNVSDTGFTVVFVKPDGTFPTESSALGFYFSRGLSSIIKNPRGKLHVYLGHVQVNMNHVDYPNGNFWFHTLMHDLTQP